VYFAAYAAAVPEMLASLPTALHAFLCSSFRFVYYRADQSIVVQGYRAVVVNNYVESAVTPFCAEYFANSSASDALKHECPYLFGSYVNGIEQFEIDPATGTCTRSVFICILCTVHVWRHSPYLHGRVFIC
jgi:hypothetical protein